MENKQLLVNKIRCPDGTILESRSRHDYRTHTQEDGEEYQIDGGISYQRFGGTCIDKITNLAMYYGDSHDLLRKSFSWGSRGTSGVEDLHYIELRDITDDHLEALVVYTKDSPIREINLVFKDEIEFRKGN